MISATVGICVFFLRSDVFVHVCFSPCRQKRTIFLIPASMRCFYTVYAVYTRQKLQLFAVIVVCLYFYFPIKVLGRVGPFPLILLPQFGGYWIEGTNHKPAEPPETDQPSCPSSHFKLETNSTAKIYRKHFMGKVRRHAK